MTASTFRVAAACALAISAVATSGAAMAQKTANFAGPMALTAVPSVFDAQRATIVVEFDVAGIQSVNALGDAGNAIRTLNIGAGSEVTGIGWNVSLNAIAPSYLSEMAVTFGDSTTYFVNLTPGNAPNPGTASYSSGGIVDLVGLGFNFAVGSDGLLNMQFFESFDDGPGVDGEWVSGSLSLQIAQVVPEPSTYALMAMGLLAMGAYARRRGNQS